MTILKKLFGHKMSNVNYIDSYHNCNKYIARTKPWDWLNEKEIYISDKVDGRPKMITLEFWPQEIYLDANGQITVKQLIDLAKQQLIDSDMRIPDNLDKELIEYIESLVFDFKVLEFSDNKISLRLEVEKPISEQ